MRSRPANISLINRRHYLPRLLLTLSSKYNDKNNPNDSQILTGHTISMSGLTVTRAKPVYATWSSAELGASTCEILMYLIERTPSIKTKENVRNIQTSLIRVLRVERCDRAYHLHCISI